MGLSLSWGLYSSTYCPSLVSSVHILKHLHTPCVKHFKRDVLCFHKTLKTLNYMLVCEPPVMVHKDTHLCSFISALKGDSLAWRYISQPHADTHIVMQSLSFHLCRYQLCFHYKHIGGSKLN